MEFKKTLVQVLSVFGIRKKYRHAIREILLHDGFSWLNSNGRTRLFFCDSNFGDALNVDLLRFFGRKVVKTPARFADVCCIGSLLEYFLSRYKKERIARPIYIFGAGFMRDALLSEERFCRPVHIYALRGRLSKKRCENILNQSLEHVVVGDPGLLIGKIFPQTKRSNKYDVGIIPHYADKGEVALKNIKLNKLSCRIIDVEEKTDEFVKQVAECSFIISSSLHGLICSDSLGIPNKPIILSDKVLGDGYKFNDYYSVFESAFYNPVDLRIDDIQDEDIEKFKSDYAVKLEEVESICRNLISAYDDMNVAIKKNLNR